MIFYPYKCKSAMSSGKDRSVLANSLQYFFAIQKVHFSPQKYLFLVWALGPGSEFNQAGVPLFL